jgi:hypothetical protein
MAPWFRVLAQDPELALEVIYLRELSPLQQGAGFGQAFQWDLPLRQGYPSRVLGAAAGMVGLPRVLSRLKAVVRELRPDAVLITGWNEPGLAAAYPLMRALGVPVILRGESNALRQRPIVRFAPAVIESASAVAGSVDPTGSSIWTIGYRRTAC